MWGRSRKESPYGLDVLRDRWDGYLYRVWGKSFQHPPRRMRWRCQFLRPHLCSLEIRLFEWDLWRFELSGMVTVVLCGGTLWVTGSSGAWVREPLGDRQFWRLVRELFWRQFWALEGASGRGLFASEWGLFGTWCDGDVVPPPVDKL